MRVDSGLLFLREDGHTLSSDRLPSLGFSVHIKHPFLQLSITAEGPPPGFDLSNPTAVSSDLSSTGRPHDQRGLWCHVIQRFALCYHLTLSTLGLVSMSSGLRFPGFKSSLYRTLAIHNPFLCLIYFQGHGKKLSGEHVSNQCPFLANPISEFFCWCLSPTLLTVPDGRGC